MLNIPTTEERLGKSPQRFVRYFVMVMSLVYMGLGIWFLWAANQPPDSSFVGQLPPTARQVLGVVFLGYGLLRFGRGYYQYFRNKPSNENE